MMYKNARLKIGDFNANGGANVFLRPNPFDLRPAVEFICDRVEKVRKNLNGRSLVLLMGEQHPVASHVLLQYLTLLKLHQHYGAEVGSGIELPYNIARSSLLEKGYGDGQINHMISKDKHGKLSLREIGCGKKIVMDAPMSHGVLLKHSLDQSISTCFTDAAFYKNNNIMVDLKDPYMKDCIETSSLEGASLLNAISPLGMTFRNAVMVDRIEKHFAATRTKLLVMGVGATHIYGDIRECGFNTSLARLFKASNIPFMAVLPFGNHVSIHRIPHDAVPSFKQTIAIHRMDEKEFSYDKASIEQGYIQHTMMESGQLKPQFFN